MYCLFRFEYFAVTLIEYLVMQCLAIVIPGGYVRKKHLSSPKNYFLFSSLRSLDFITKQSAEDFEHASLPGTTRKK